jgi:hypothetical protein
VLNAYISTILDQSWISLLKINYIVLYSHTTFWWATGLNQNSKTHFIRLITYYMPMHSFVVGPDWCFINFFFFPLMPVFICFKLLTSNYSLSPFKQTILYVLWDANFITNFKMISLNQQVFFLLLLSHPKIIRTD